jgi:hypothetical protein
MTCSHGHLDGAYVLGALSPEERLEYERHLPSCPTCSRAVRELAGLPGLLSQAPVDVLESAEDPVPLPDTLLPSLVREVRRGERRRRQVTWLAAAAAALVVGGGTAAVVLHDDGGTGRVPAAVATAPAHAMTPAGQGDLEARLSMTPVLWGTRLDLTCRYATPAAGGAPYPHEPASGAATYTLVVRSAGGAEQQVAAWRAVPGRTLRLSGATSWAPKDIAEVQVRAADGTPVLTLQG